MLRLTYNDTPDIESFAKDIGADGAKIFVNVTKMKLLAVEYEARAASAQNTLEMLIASITKRRYTVANTVSIVSTLTEFCGCQRSRFLTEAGNISLDMKKVVEPLIESLKGCIANPNYPGQYVEDALLLLCTYKEYKSLNTRRSQMAAKLKRVQLEDVMGWGNSLGSVSFKYRSCETGRYYTYDDSIQNWPLELCEAITVPQDFFLVWADFDQIDFRVGYHIFLREPGSDADQIYLAATDKYRGMYEIICRAAGKEPDFDLFTKYRKAYKKAILSAMYNASEQSLFNDIRNHELAHELYQYFQNNKKYQAFRSSINRLLEYHVDAIVKDYFGFTRSIPLPNLSNNKEVNDAISKCCNTPIQSTSFSILQLWLEKTLELFEKNGFSRETHIKPYLIRHDECIFMVHKSMYPKLYLFKDVMTVAVDDWDKITLEPHFGVYYKKPLEDMEAAYQSQCLQHANEINVAAPLAEARPRYRPIQEVLDVYAYDMMPIKKRTLANFEQAGIQLPEGISENSEDWSDDDCFAILKKIVESRPDCTMLRNIIEYRNRFLVYSRKLNKYKLANTLSYAVACAHELDTDKVIVYNTGADAGMLHEGVMFRFSTSKANKAAHLFSRIKELGYPEGWVALD